MRTLRISINWQKLSKIFFLLYMLYSNVISYSLLYIGNLSLILLIAAIGFEIIHDGFRLKHNKCVGILFLFSIYLLASGLVVAKNYALVFTTTISFIENLVVFYLVVAYTCEDRKPDYTMVVFIVQAILSIIIMLISGVDTKRISISESVNVNTLGMMFAIAIGFTLYLMIRDNNKPVVTVGGFSLVLLMVFAIMLTGSKKGIIAGAILVLLFVIICYRKTIAKMHIGLKILLIVFLTGVFIYLFKWFTENYAMQMEFSRYRMSLLYEGDSDQKRIQLFKEGLLIFLSHPLFGTGFNNARYYTSYLTYTHCFYSEVLACTGIIGTIIFGYALFYTGYKLSNKRRRDGNQNSVSSIRNKYISALFFVLLALSIAQILFYSPIMMYMFAVIVGTGYLEE